MPHRSTARPPRPLQPARRAGATRLALLALFTLFTLSARAAARLTIAPTAPRSTAQPPPPSARPRAGVNAVLGDDSYVARFGVAPAPGTDETLRLVTHLEYVEALLRARDVSALSPALRAERARNLDRLHAYLRAAVFPRNHHVPGRRPHFIDEDGRICAVGYLVEQSAGRSVAEAINRDFEWAYVPDIRGEAVDRWISASGLTRDELAMIQPSYEWERPRPSPIEPPSAMPRPTEPQLEARLVQATPGVQRCLHDARSRARSVQVGVVLYPARGPSVSILGLDEHNRAPFAAREPAAAACIERAVRVTITPLVHPFRGRPLAATHAFESAGAHIAEAPPPSAPDSQRLRAALDARLREVTLCLPPPPPRGSGGMNVSFRATAQPDGSLSEVQIEAPALGNDPNVVSCLSNVVQSVRLEGTRARPVPVAFTLHLGR